MSCSVCIQISVAFCCFVDDADDGSVYVQADAKVEYIDCDVHHNEHDDDGDYDGDDVVDDDDEDHDDDNDVVFTNDDGDDDSAVAHAS